VSYPLSRHALHSQLIDTTVTCLSGGPRWLGFAGYTRCRRRAGE